MCIRDSAGRVDGAEGRGGAAASASERDADGAVVLLLLIARDFVELICEALLPPWRYCDGVCHGGAQCCVDEAAHCLSIRACLFGGAANLIDQCSYFTRRRANSYQSVILLRTPKPLTWAEA